MNKKLSLLALTTCMLMAPIGFTMDPALDQDQTPPAEQQSLAGNEEPALQNWVDVQTAIDARVSLLPAKITMAQLNEIAAKEFISLNGVDVKVADPQALINWLPSGGRQFLRYAV